MSAPIAHVLFDADGVLQEIPGGWYAAIEPHLGERSEEFMRYTWKEECPTLAGEGDYLEVLARDLRTFGIDTPAEVVFADVWQNIQVHDDVLALVEAIRAAGYGVHLGTNQDRHRGEYMRQALGYERIFEVLCYSYDLGVAKPDPAFFAEAARRIGADPGEILFIDDHGKNVEGAREAGMPAFRWTTRDGLPELRDLLAGHRVTY